MEPAGQNGMRTDHDRDLVINGVNGASAAGHEQVAPDKGKAPATASHHDAVNGGDSVGAAAPSGDQLSRMNDLPDEIVHITQGFVPLSLLLTRLAQVSHNSLQEKVAELAKMPIPGAAVNGNATYNSSGPDDNSNENLRKKASLASFAQDMHGKWLKALVIAEWSRKAGAVSKLIDLKFHIDQQRILYDATLDNVVNLKRDLTFARMPSPDLKTALQVLSTGSAPWIPDLGYLDPPPMTPTEEFKWFNDLNTLLSLRLNLEDYDKIPYAFRNYEIGSGRVTFKVDGEFEVDLTIADEDFDKQFWFIDFRYAFTPSASSLSDSLRSYLEGCVNDALSKDGLVGCYNFLHEFVLTCKINELKRQALLLSRGSWTGTLAVEPLNRSLAIQYWTPRTAITGTKSWVLIAINSGRQADGKPDPKSSSFLSAKWYRDSKEVKDVEIDLNVQHLSAESLLSNIVGRHIQSILTNTHDKLLSAARYKNRQASMVLDVSTSDPAASYLATQIGENNRACLLVEPTTGAFAVKPHSKFTVQYEHQLNTGKNPAEDGVACLENARCAIMEDDISRRGSSMGWFTRKAPLTIEEIKSATKLREWTRAIWLQKDGWGASWFVGVFLGLGGDEWWLLEANRDETNRPVKFKAKLALDKGYPDRGEEFWNNLALFATGIMTQSIDMRELLRHRIKNKSSAGAEVSLPHQVRIPCVKISLSALFPAMVSDTYQARSRSNSSGSDSGVKDAALSHLMQKYAGAALESKQAWAEDMVTINFKGIQSMRRPGEETKEGDTPTGVLVCESEAVIRVRRPSQLAALRNLMNRDVSYNVPRGEFSLRLRRPVGGPLLDTLKTRIKSIDRFINFFEALEKASGVITREAITLKFVAFSYSELPSTPPASGEDGQDDAPTTPPRRWRVGLDLSKDDIDIRIEDGNPHLRVVDLMRKLVNTDGGIGALMAWLPASLPALRAIDDMQSQWDSLTAEKRGRVEVSMKSIAWMSIAYTLPSPDSGGKDAQKRVTLEVRLKPKQGEAWWHVWRSDPGTKASPDDEFTKALKPVWASRGQGWLGLTTGAAGKPSGGVVGMLSAVDEAIRGAAQQVAAATTADGAKIKKEGGQQQEVVILD
ncbi:mediator-RNA polymerase II transcription subunit 14 [Purpureocillium lilacinum]|uniref:Mediator of RNA polymerase II transcription subunit 14 n=1 Tax=Purpureocillium lilacinum TaxID=33203 RepID=A0A179HPV0_PURLI|nr:mediator-RNA polymerase II transcription subunit 14 [Purpureocillium lilacinum]OAQ91571.1 mediator-RNA polymerase II transcription subunit 14 [Purpureocillium lilacinum]